MNIDGSKITRLEIISKKGRELVKYNCKFNLAIQDEGQTLKVFIEEENEK